MMTRDLTVRKKKSLASHLLQFSTEVKKGQPAIYKLHSTENISARNENAKTRKFELGEYYQCMKYPYI